MFKKAFPILIFYPFLCFADSIEWTSKNSKTVIPSSFQNLIAQNDEIEGEEENEELNVYDPFTDYLDFEDLESEQEGITFFQMGRFLSIGGYVGYRHFLGISHLTNFIGFGGFLNYFINLHFAMQFTYVGSQHHILINPTESSILGRTFYNTLKMEFKYYWNREKLIRPLAFFNPYISGGPLMIYRITAAPTRITPDGVTDLSERGYGIHGGAGIEIHLSKRFYIGVHANYAYVVFNNEKEITLPNDNTIYLPGNLVTALFIFGSNF